MDLEELQKFQKDFDNKIGFRNRKGNLNDLAFDTIAISGEMGEFANLVKKKLRLKSGRVRNDELGKNFNKELSEELIDILIYLLKLSIVLNTDLEKEYFKKLKKVKSRFSKKKN